MTNIALQIPGYQLERELGRGGMGRVYLARQMSLDRPVALKVLNMADAEADAEKALATALREGSVLALLQHAHIVAIYDRGTLPDGRPYLVMEYVEGGDLTQRIAPNLSWDWILQVMLPLTNALAYAHHKGIIHRDIKPQNILFNRDQAPLLADFGIAKLMGSGHATRTQTQAGTAAYISPEQALGKKVDARSDLYSLGVVFYELITGQRPYDVEDPSDQSSAFALIFKHINDPIPRLPAQLAWAQGVVDKLLAKDQDARYQSAEELRAALLAVKLPSAKLPPTQPLPQLEATVIVPHVPSPPAAKPQSGLRHRGAVIAGGAVLLVLLLAAGVAYRQYAPLAPDPDLAEIQRKAEVERQAQETAAAQRKAEVERQAQETAAAQRKAEVERQAQETAAAQRKAEAERQAQETAQRKAESERQAQETAAAQRKAEAERQAQAAAAQRKAEAERQAQETAAAQRKAEAERQAQAAAAQRKAEQETVAQRKAEAERQAQAAAAQRKAEQAEADRRAGETAAAQRKAETQRKAQETAAQRKAEQAEAERRTGETAAAQRKAEAERQAQAAAAQRKAEQAEAERRTGETAELQRKLAEAERRARAAEESQRQVETEPKPKPKPKADIPVMIGF